MARLKKHNFLALLTKLAYKPNTKAVGGFHTPKSMCEPHYKPFNHEAL